jgi:hypothetical protein
VYSVVCNRHGPEDPRPGALGLLGFKFTKMILCFQMIIILYFYLFFFKNEVQQVENKNKRNQICSNNFLTTKSSVLLRQPSDTHVCYHRRRASPAN